jgi:hypothetical protein
MKKYKQFYTSSLFNIENIVNYGLDTTFINVLTDEDFEVFNKIGVKQVIYNIDCLFFKHLNIVSKVIQSDIPIYSDNIRIRQYLFKNGKNVNFIEKKYINIKNLKLDTNLSLFKRFDFSSDEKVPMVVKMDGNILLIIERLIKKLPTIIVDKIDIWEIEDAVCKNRLLYVENVNEFIKGITDNLYISDALKHFKERFQTFYLKNDYHYSDICVFFGIYSGKDIEILRRHRGYKFLIWGGTDCNWNYRDRVKNLDVIKNIPDLYHIAISKDIQDRLRLKNIESIFLELDLVDKELFKPVSEKGDSIFIYNGFTKGNEDIYGKRIYMEVVKRLPKFKFIYSNQLNLPHEEMPKIYAKCFIGLRLTEHDGNANMVQEMKAMNIPVVHNQSDYGLKWWSIDDIITSINMYKI